MKFEIHYSRDKTLFYITADSNKFRPRYWMSFDKIPGAATEEQIKKAEAGSIFGRPLVEFKLNGGEVYCREALPFSFWKVRSGDVESISVDDDLWKDYACFHDWSL